MSPGIAVDRLNLKDLNLFLFGIFFFVCRSIREQRG